MSDPIGKAVVGSPVGATDAKRVRLARMAEDESAKPDAMLEASGLEFTWPGANPPSRKILDGMTLSVEVGEVMCLMGPNGCGKTTFIDCVLGENRPDAGQILLAGRDARAMTARERALIAAYVPQSRGVTFPYTVRHMVELGRTAHVGANGLLGAEDEDAVESALASCGIAHLADRALTELSGGEAQMAVLARALAQAAPLVVLDEPTAHLDFRNELVFLEAVETLAVKRRSTVLMATHAPNQAFHLAAAGLRVRVAVMGAGKVVACGPPADVLVPDVMRRAFGVRACVCEGVGDMPPHVVPLGTDTNPLEGNR